MSSSNTNQTGTPSNQFNLLTSSKDVQEVLEKEHPTSKGRKATPYIATQAIRNLDEAERDADSNYIVLRIRATRSVKIDERPLAMFTPDADVQHYLRRSRQTNGEELVLAFDRDEAEMEPSLTDSFAASKLIEHLDAAGSHHDLPVNYYAVMIESQRLNELGRSLHTRALGKDPGDAYYGPFVLIFRTRKLNHKNPNDEPIYEQMDGLHDGAKYWSGNGLKWGRNALELRQIYSAGAWADTPESQAIVTDELGGQTLSLRQVENRIFGASPHQYDKYGFADSIVAAKVVREIFGAARTGYRLYEWDQHAGWYQADVIS